MITKVDVAALLTSQRLGSARVCFGCAPSSCSVSEYGKMVEHVKLIVKVVLNLNHRRFGTNYRISLLIVTRESCQRTTRKESRIRLPLKTMGSSHYLSGRKHVFRSELRQYWCLRRALFPYTVNSRTLLGSPSQVLIFSCCTIGVVQCKCRMRLWSFELHKVPRSWLTVFMESASAVP